MCDYKWIQSQNKGMDIGFPNTLADFHRLYPPSAGAGAAVASALHALGALVRPVMGAGRGGRAPARAASGGLTDSRCGARPGGRRRRPALPAGAGCIPI